MGFLTSLRSKMGQGDAEFGEGERYPLTKQLVVTIKRHMMTLKDTDLTNYTFERRPSDYRGARADLVIYNEQKQPVLHGREPQSGPTSIWPY